MKKIVVLFCTVLASLVSFGQGYQYNAKYNEPFQTETFIGARGGLNFSQVGFQPLQDPNKSYRPDVGNLQTFHAGLVVRHISERLFGIQAELNYTQKGWEERANDDFPERIGVDYSRTLNYLEIPIMTHINIGKRNFRYFINLGPSVSYLMSEDETLTLDPTVPNAPTQIDSLAYYGNKVDSEFDFQFVAGTGFEYRTKIGTIGAEARYSLSIINLFDESDYVYNNSLNQSIGVSMYWLFQTNRREKRNAVPPKKKRTYN